jgi:putative metallopeptidase
MKKAKAVAYRLIHPDGSRVYAWLRELLDAYHPDVAEARFVLVWHTNWHADDDGRLTLGMCQKASDLTREIADAAAYDFVILLNQNFWDDPLVTDDQRRALLDHELCHAAVKRGDDGALVIDERGRVTYRLRKHDLEEFSSIAERYGCWKRDLETFGHALAKARNEDHWVGYQRLHVALIGVGAPVPLDAIYAWSADERREASVWATAFREAAPGSTIEGSCPPHVMTAITSAKQIGPS